MHIDKYVKLITSGSSNNELTVDIDSGKFRVYGGWNWDTRNPSMPGHVECLIRARHALIANHVDAITVCDGDPRHAIWYLDGAIDALLGRNMFPECIPNEVWAEVTIKHDEKLVDVFKTTTWKNWEAGFITTRFEYIPQAQEGLRLKISTAVTMDYKFDEWIEYVAGRKTKELALDVLTQVVER